MNSLRSIPIAFCIGLAAWGLSAHAGVFSSEFNEAGELAEQAHTTTGGAAPSQGMTYREGNRNGRSAKESLETAETVKTVSDVVGLAATTATVGSFGYDAVTSSNNQKKIDDLKAQYNAALASGNKEKAAQILQQLDKIKAQISKTASDQASTQSNLATIQNVAGYANLGAAAGSAAAAFIGFQQSSQLREGACSGNGLQTPSEAGTAPPGASASPVRNAQNCSDFTKSTQAVAKARSAAWTATYYAAGEAAIGMGSLYLGSKSSQNAKNLESLAADPIPGAQERELAIYDQLALTKCGASMTYSLSDPAISATTSSKTDSSGAIVRNVASVATATDEQSTYSQYYGRITCLSVQGGTSTTTAPVTASSDIYSASKDTQCSTDVFRCTDGTYVTRDPELRCEFRACPVTTTSSRL